jgi:ankyrin repeat protein
VNAPKLLTQKGTFLDDLKNEKFRLNFAAYSENVKKVKLLIDEGENTATKIGETSLHIAAFKGNVAIA